MRVVQPHTVRDAGAPGASHRSRSGSIGAVLRSIPGQVGTAIGMSASVAEYQRMQRELFGLLHAFVVLNDTARRILVAMAPLPASIVVNRLGVSQTGIVRKPDPAARRRRARCDSGTWAVSIRRRDSASWRKP
jgi:hypothetical protein